MRRCDVVTMLATVQWSRSLGAAGDCRLPAPNARSRRLDETKKSAGFAESDGAGPEGPWATAGTLIRINIYGLGYVGSVSAACLAADGHDVLGVDSDRLKVDSINRGESAVVEPGLPELIHRGVAAGKLRATSDVIEDAEVLMVCVGTPSNANGSLCLDQIARVASEIGGFLRGRDGYRVVCIRVRCCPARFRSS